MRIIIETEPAALQPRVSYESAGEPVREAARDAAEDAQEAALDGGQPADELLAAFGAAADASSQQLRTDNPRDGVRRSGEDAGGAPPWLVAVIEGGESRRRTQ
jgi:hypothetical protein